MTSPVPAESSVTDLVADPGVITDGAKRDLGALIDDAVRAAGRPSAG